MKREPYITKLDKDNLEQFPVGSEWGDDLTPQLAIVSRVIWRGQEKGYYLMCRSLSHRGRTVFLPRWGYKAVREAGPDCGFVEVEEDRWLEPFDRIESVWVEVGDHIIYFAEEETFLSKTGWTFAKALERCFAKIQAKSHYRVLVGGTEVYQGISLLDAKSAVPFSVDPTEIGNKFAKAFNLEPVPIGVEVHHRYGPRGDWVPLTDDQLAQAGFRHAAIAV